MVMASEESMDGWVGSLSLSAADKMLAAVPD